MRVFDKCRKYHKQMWGWLAETGKRNKGDWPEFKEINPPANTCFACAYADKVLNEKSCDWNVSRCQYCPIDWGSNPKQTCFCEGIGSPYLTWWINSIKGGSPQERKRLAAIIRDLPWKDKSKVK